MDITRAPYLPKSFEFSSWTSLLATPVPKLSTNAGLQRHGRSADRCAGMHARGCVVDWAVLLHGCDHISQCRILLDLSQVLPIPDRLGGPFRCQALGHILMSRSIVSAISTSASARMRSVCTDTIIVYWPPRRSPCLSTAISCILPRRRSSAAFVQNFANPHLSTLCLRSGSGTVASATMSHLPWLSRVVGGQQRSWVDDVGEVFPAVAAARL